MQLCNGNCRAAIVEYWKHFQNYIAGHMKMFSAVYTVVREMLLPSHK